jgi:AraC family transcriptional regulator, regulatory protein of adaptative response / methylated-DNA-[protein]-cysteine methyltransferase
MIFMAEIFGRTQMKNSEKNARQASRTTADARWFSVVARDPQADGRFYYSVKTTGIYCRPTCSARRARPENVCFFATREEAEGAGFRPCRRCKPDQASLIEKHTATIAQACRYIDESEEMPSLEELANKAGLSSYYFHRLFKSKTGLTPKEYAAGNRARRVQGLLERSRTVTEAIYEAGFNSNGRFYENSNEVLGMTPTTYRTGGAGTDIYFAIGECSLGFILVARSERGVCAVLLGDDADDLTRDLQTRFPRAKLIGGDTEFEQLVSKIVSYIEAPAVGLELPLDVRGTSFQRRVWQALRKIPSGSTASYSDIAKLIGEPKAVRAVAQACGANPLAVVIPCHRVVRSDGALSGYRWGVERKRALLEREMRG